MKRLLLNLLIFSVYFNIQCQEYTDADIYSHVPSLDELSGAWLAVDTVDMEPSLRNFRAQALTNNDLTSLSWFASAPYSGGYHTGTFRINGTTPLVSHFRWQPYQTLRRCNLDNDTEIVSTTRMVVDKNIIMWQVKITNNASSAQDYNVELDQIGFLDKYDGEDWQWWYPYPTLKGKTTDRDEVVEGMRDAIGTGLLSHDIVVEELVNGRPTTITKTAYWPSDKDILNTNLYRAKYESDILSIRSNQSEVCSSFKLFNSADSIQLFNAGGTAYWKIHLPANESHTIMFAMSWGDKSQSIETLLAIEDASDFFTEWNQIETEWNHRWLEIFRPNNDIISGAFPILETQDSLVRRVYYTGPLTMLYLMHTNLPQHKRVFLTGGPRWGATITFFWDITEWSSLWAVVDPEMMKENLIAWMKIDPNLHFGQDNLMGGGVGNGYSANYWAIFQMIRSYLVTTGDYDFLNDVINDKTILDHLIRYATNWKNLSIYDPTLGMDDTYHLADFGDDEWNLLECVPTYKHIVPSFNAGYIWMMKETAELCRNQNRDSIASQLETDAARMVSRLLKLYAGNGVWTSLYPDGSKIEVRHCLDFMFIGRYISDEIPDTIRNEMIQFVFDELITDKWMRAQSIKDIAAKDSDRPDHGPLGAFDGWPAGTMDALVQMGYEAEALKFYHAIAPVTKEGIWAQAHELWGENKWNKNAQVRIAKRGWHNRESSAGIAFSQVVLKDFFGFNPSFDGLQTRTTSSINLQGKLYHVKYRNKYYTLQLNNGIFTMVEE